MELVVNKGVVEKPSLIKKVRAMAAGDKEAVIILSPTDIQSIVVDKIFQESTWLRKYTHGHLDFDVQNNSYVVTFSKKD
jgi:hypothetical protein